MAPTAAAQVMAKAEARARLDPEFVEILARLVDAPSSSAGELEQLAAQEISAQRRREAVDDFRSSALPTAAVQDLLGLGTPQAVHRLRSRGRLIGMQLGNHTWFPAWQFSGGRIRADMPRLLEILGRFTADPVAADRVMRLRRDDLEGSSLTTALDRPELAGAAWTVLTELAG